MCAACVAFTEMLGLDSTALRVDIQAADRLLAHTGLEDLLGDDSKEGNTMEDAIGNGVNLAFVSVRMNHFKLKVLSTFLGSMVKNYFSNTLIIHQV